jgi:hypothetical protein
MSVHIALAPFLLDCRSVLTLGVRPCIGDYSPAERELLRNARRILFPTPRFLDVFEAASISTFPSPASYRYPRSRVLQALLFQVLGWPSARTRIYFGKHQKGRVLRDFQIPFDALSPKPGSGEPHRIESLSDFESIPDLFNPLVIREVLPWEDQIRVTAVQHECLAAHRLTAGSGRSEPGHAVALSAAEVAPLLKLNRKLTRLIHLDDISIEWGYCCGQWHLIEMTSPPLHIRTCEHSINRHSYICGLVGRGIL